MNKVNAFLKKTVPAVAFLSVIWAVPAVIHAVYPYLVMYEIDVNSSHLLIMDGIFAVLTIAGFLINYRKFRDVFFVAKVSVHVVCALATQLVLLAITGSVLFHFIIAGVSAWTICERCGQMKLKGKDRLQEINDILRYHVYDMTFVCILFICSQLFNVMLLTQFMTYFNISNTYLAALSIIALNSIACFGVLFLYRVIYLNVANKIING